MRRLNATSSGWRAIVVVTAALMLSMATLHAEDAPPVTGDAPKPAAKRADAFEAHEWLLLLSDPHVDHANAETMFDSTLPDVVRTRRPSAKTDLSKAMPVGVIALHGSPGDPPREVDVLIESPKANFLDHWPRAASRTYRLLWQGMKLSESSTDARLLTPGHWVDRLRDNPALYVTQDNRAERFMLYDVELPISTPLKLDVAGAEAKPDAKADDDRQPDQYTVTNIGAFELLDVTVYQPSGDGWRVGRVDRLAVNPARPADDKSNDTKSPRKGPREAAAGAIKKLQVTRGAGGQVKIVANGGNIVVNGGNVVINAQAVAIETDDGESGAPKESGKPDASSTTQAAKPASAIPTGPFTAKVAMGAEVQSADKLITAWRDAMKHDGYTDVEADHMAAMLKANALEPDHATVVCRLGAPFHTDVLKLDITPEPDRKLRTALMVIRNADPGIKREIARLVKQLGDDQWKLREAASERLAAYGEASADALRTALKSSDLEVVYRAERLLDRMSDKKKAGDEDQ
ncbi:MAG: hypothetical protein GC159_15830 [Phycisphaera sp.]|nr:hypothetical protein [Phycisphaera sp.]